MIQQVWYDPYNDWLSVWSGRYLSAFKSEDITLYYVTNQSIWWEMIEVNKKVLHCEFGNPEIAFGPEKFRLEYIGEL